MSGSSIPLIRKVKSVEFQAVPSFNATKLVGKITVNKVTCPEVDVSFDGISIILKLGERTFLVPYTNVKGLELEND